MTDNIELMSANNVTISVGSLAQRWSSSDRPMVRTSLIRAVALWLPVSYPGRVDLTVMRTSDLATRHLLDVVPTE